MTQLGARGQAKLAEEIASRSTIVPESFKLRLAKEIGKTAAAESITEPIQEATDIIAEQLAGAPGGLSDPKNVDRLLMAAAKGGIGGAAIGTPGALVQTMRETPAKEPELPLNETKKAGSVGPGPAENLAAAMQKRKAQEAITEDEFQLLVQNGVLKDNPQTRASVKFAAPSTDPSLEEQTNAATTREAVQNDEVANAALAQAALQQAQQQNQQNDQVRQDALAQAQAANEQRQARDIAEYQGKRQAEAEAQIQQAQAKQLYDEATKFVIDNNKATPSALVKQFNIGFNEAAQLLQQMESNGVVSAINPDGTRSVTPQQAQQNVQPNTPPPSNVTPPSGESAGVPSGPQGGVPPAGVATPPPPRVATVRKPTKQTGVGETAQPSSVELGSPEDEWDNQFRFYSSEPKWQDLDPEYKFLWEDAHKNKRLTTSLFDQLVDLQTPGIVRRSQDYLGRPYSQSYAAKEAGLPADRAAIVKAKKTNRIVNSYFTMPRVVDNLTNLAHDIVFGSRSAARPKLGEKVEDTDLTKEESKEVAGHYNRTSAATLKKLDEWVRANLTEGAVKEYDRQLDIQRSHLSRLQLGKLTTKAKERTAKAEKDADEKAANEAEATRQAAVRAAQPSGPAPVTVVDPAAAQRKLDEIRQLNEAKIKRAAERAKTPEELAEQRAKEAEGQKTPLEIAQEEADAKAEQEDAALSNEARKAKERAAEEAANTADYLQKEQARKEAERAAARAAAPQPAETPAITRPERSTEARKEEAPAKPSGTLPEGKPPLNTIVFSKDPENGSMYTPEAVKNYGDMVVSVTGTGPNVSFTPPIEIDNYSVTGAYINIERLGVNLITVDGDEVNLTLLDDGNLLELDRWKTQTLARLYRDKPDPKIEVKFRRAFGDDVINTFLKGTTPDKFLTKLTGVDVEPRFREVSAAFEKQYLVDKPAQYAEGAAYKPLSDKFPISREDFARALGITTHNRAWLATDFNAELADAATRGDMPAVIKALLASKNPIIRDIALRAQATQRFLPSDRIKIKIADEELREVDLEKGRQPGNLAGMFDGGNNTILLNSVYAGSEHTIAHEIVHGLTEKIIKMPYPGNQLEGVNRLKRLHKDVLAKAKIVYKTDNLKELPYGFRSESEFIAEGLSNPEFQYLLAALPHEGKTSSMWTEFVRAIAQLLGLKDHNALTELLDIYSVMLEQDLPPNKNVSGAVTAALIGAPPPPNNNYPLVPDDLPANARVPSTVSTPPAALPQVALNRTMVGPMQQLLDAPKNSEFFINAADAAGRWGLSLLPTWNIAANARDMGFDQIGEIENSLRKAGAMKDTILKRSSDFMTKALAIAKADPAGKKAMDAFVNRASGLAIDVTRSKTPTPEFAKARPDSVADYVSLRAEYDKLHPKFQKLASDLVDQYRQFRDKYFEALKKSVRDQYQDDPVKADKILSGLDEKYKKFNEAYTPFVRIGDYWITYVNPDTGKDVAESYTSLGAQKTRLDELKKAGIVYVQSFKQTDFRKFSYKSGPVNQFFDEIKGNVVKALPIYKDDSPATAERIREAREDMMERLYQASLLLHPESSMLRQFGLERKGTLGYIEDTLAAYDQKAPVYATQISQVANKGEIEHQIDSARKQNASNPDTKMSDIITHVAKIVYGVDTIRADDPLNKIANNVNKLGFTYYMGFNPASALVNMLQTPTVMFPLLAGEFHGLGQLKIMNTLFSNMTKIISESLGQQTYGEKLVESAEAKIDAAVAKGKTREEAIAALPEMERVFLSFRDEGILNAGNPSHDFGSVTKNGSGETSAFGKGVHAFTKYSATMFQRAEAINREAGALATYQLMKQRLSGKAGMNDQEKYAQAISKATEMVTKAHGDYQQGLAPKIFLNPAMRVIFMFKKFPAHMAALYIRLFKEMFSGADSDVRKVARIQLTGLMSMSAIFAGTMGMPFYYIVRDLMNLMLDDEDDPYDFDFAFYNYLSDMWGQPMANRITRGWLGDLGGDVASKVGYASSPLLGGTKQLPFIGGLLGLRDGKNTASTEDDLKNYIAEAAGASAGMALQIARGVDKLAQGDVYRFLEGVAPMAAMRNIAKSIRLSTEGALTTRGEPIIEDVTLVETILQAAGITPQRLASQYQLNAWQKDIEKQLLDRRQSLLNQYFNAQSRQDYETMADIRDEMQRFSAVNPEKGLKITSETLAASARTRAKQSAETKAGIYLSKPFRQRFADVPVYAEE
jgi:ribosomal protein S25